VKPTGGHEEMQEIIPDGSEQGSGREEDHIPATTLENQSEDDEDTNESICMKIVSIIHDIGQTLCEIDDCQFKDEIAEISEIFSKISLQTPLHFSYAAHSEHEQALMDRSRKSLTKQAGLTADLHSSSSEDEEDSDEESKKKSRYIDYEAEEDGNNEDDFSPDYEAGEEGGNENSGGQETADPYMNLLVGETVDDLDTYGFDLEGEWGWESGEG
jgi:hypothetical protein